MRTRTVLITLFDGVEALDVAGPLGVFAGANDYLAQTSPGRTAYRILQASPGGTPVSTRSGLTLVPDGDLQSMSTPHTLIVPGGSTDPQSLGIPNPALVEWLRSDAAKSQRVMSVCTGAFLLAEAGLLAGHRVTTHWSRADELARRYPEIHVDADPIFIRDGKISTSAGVTSGIDLALALVEDDLGRLAAMTIARYLVMFLRRPGNQRQFSMQLQAQLAQRPNLRGVQQWIADHPDADLSVDALARRAGLSPRQFARAFTAETGTSPGRYVDNTRLETARRLLEDTCDSVERIARSSGYPTPEAMRRAFQRALGVSPAQYRHRT